MSRILLIALVLTGGVATLPGCGSDSGGVEIKTVPPITEEEKQSMENYERAQQEAAKAYR